MNEDSVKQILEVVPKNVKDNLFFKNIIKEMASVIKQDGENREEILKTREELAHD